MRIHDLEKISTRYSLHMTFLLTSTDDDARAGTLSLPHGEVFTPIFMPVGTYGAVRGLSNDILGKLGAQIILGNTFHLWLRPGLENIKKKRGSSPIYQLE